MAYIQHDFNLSDLKKSLVFIYDFVPINVIDDR